MRNIGSLYQFLEPQQNPLLTAISTQNSQPQPIPSPLKPRLKTTLEQYHPTPKLHLSKSNNKSSVSPDPLQYKRDLEQETDTWKQLIHRYKMNKNYHMPINNSFMLPKKIHVIEMHSRKKYGIDQGLLRALEKIKVDEEKIRGRESRDYEDSFDRFSQTMTKLKLVPLQNLQQLRLKQQDISQNQQYKLKQTSKKSTLSNTKRIEFERCLSWAKKHNKDRKVKVIQNWNQQVKKRKKLLTVLDGIYKREEEGNRGHGGRGGHGGHEGNEGKNGRYGGRKMEVGDRTSRNMKVGVLWKNEGKEGIQSRKVMNSSKRQRIHTRQQQSTADRRKSIQ